MADPAVRRALDAHLAAVASAMRRAGAGAEEIAAVEDGLREQAAAMLAADPGGGAAAGARRGARRDPPAAYGAPRPAPRHRGRRAGSAILAALLLAAIGAASAVLLTRPAPPRSPAELDDLARTARPVFVVARESFEAPGGGELRYRVVHTDETSTHSARRLVVLDLAGETSPADFLDDGFRFWEVVVLQPDPDAVRGSIGPETPHPPLDALLRQTAIWHGIDPDAARSLWIVGETPPPSPGGG